MSKFRHRSYKYTLTALLSSIVLSLYLFYSVSTIVYGLSSGSDTFTRSVTGGWGTADSGGSYTLTGTAADFNVSGTEGTMSVTAAGQNKIAFLSSISAQDVDTTVRVKTDKAPTGSTEVAYLLARHISTGNEYRGRLILNTNGTVVVSATKLVASTETTIGSQITVSGLTYATDTYIYFHLQVTGTNPTTIQMRAWADGSSEPSSWQYSSTDSDSVLQTAGSVGLQSRLSSTVSNAPVLFTWDDYTITSNDPTPTTAPTNTPAPTSTATPTPTATSTPTPTPTPYSTASDTFARTVSSGWGTADVGGSYTLTGTAADFNVSGGIGTINMPSAGSSKYATLGSVSMQDVDMKFKVKIDKVPTSATSGDAGASIIVRRIGSDEYRGRLKFTTAGTTTVVASTLVSNVETTLGTTTTVSGLTPTADTYVWFRGQFIGTNPTVIRLKAWADGATEPTSWNYTQNDSTSEFQTSGAVSMRTSLPAAVDNAPILFSFDNFDASVGIADTPTPTSTPVPTYSLSGTVYNDVNGNGVQDGGETGYQNATVTISGSGSANTTTNSSGVYSFSSLGAGTYTETLSTPTGYLSTTTNPVSVALSANTTVNYGIQTATTSTIAADTFTRTTSSSWGTADTGGSYTQVGTASSFSVNGAEGIINMTGTGSVNQRTLRLDNASAQNIDYTIKLRYDKLPDITAGNYTFLIGRHVSSGNEYRGWIRVNNSGTVFLRSSKIVSGAETALATEVTVSGLTYNAGDWLNARLQVLNTTPATINFKVWKNGTSEPGSWQYSTTDSASILQQSGSIGIVSRLGAVGNTPVQLSFDDLQVTRSTIITPTATPSPTATPIPTTPYSFSDNITTVFTIVMENQDWSSIEGNTTSAPYINSLITGLYPDHTTNQYHSDTIFASNYKSVLAGETVSGYMHPSEPNYIWLEAGTNVFGDTTFTADNSPSTQSTTSTAHIATLLNNAGKTWRAYQENKPSGCPIGNGTLFIPRHSPFVYFQDVSSLNAPSGVGSPSSSSTYCSNREFDFTQLATDLGTGGSGVANYNFITPNLCNDMHDSGCPGSTDKINSGDIWLQNNLPTILNSDLYKAGHATIFILWDEDAGSTSNNQIGMMALSPKTKGNGYTNSVAYSHSSYVKTIENIFSLSPLLGHAADSGTSDFSDLFGDPVIATAGDIACGVGSTSASCQQQQTADLITQINPSAVLPLGDNQYENGALSDFLSYYDPSWGAYKALTAPSVGNHEYLTSSAQGYFDYFNGVGNQSGLAGDRTKGYYSYNLGNWHLIALNTNCSQAGGCDVGSAQEAWLRADLANNPGKCLLAYAHHPRYSSGQQPHNAGVDALYNALYSYHADVFLAGHDHNYERFYNSDNNGFINASTGIAEFIVGTGGRNHTQLSGSGIASNSASFDASTFGVLKMTLHNSSYDWEFLPSASSLSFTNGTFTETGSFSCHYISTPTSTVTPSPTPTSTLTYTLSGTVYTDTNSNGVQDGGESGYPSATLKLSGAGTQTTTTDSSGNYSFTSLGSGTYTTTLHLPTGYQSITTNPSSTSLSVDTTVNFGISTVTSSFQPTTPFYTTFFYNWYKNSTIDGSNQWGIWADSDAGGTHSPPANWFSNYLPQPTPGVFSTSSGLYSSNDYTIFKWQLTKLLHAKQEVAIASWWGQGDRSDQSFSNEISDYMYRADNPYPNLRLGLYYECEGNTCNGTQNPSVSQIVSDLNYIATNFANQPAYLRINGKPVIFVYADPNDSGTSDSGCTDSSMTSRWYQANRLAITQFYIVLKVFGGYTSDACQPDDWHQYAPAVRTDRQGTYSYMVSPGFWKSGESLRLSRDLSAFTNAIQNMVSANTTWKIVETWNEWGEGTAVEPGIEVTQATGSATATQNNNGTTFGESYIDTLNLYLPDLEEAAGLTATPTPTPSQTVHTLSGTVYVDTNSNGVQDGGENGYQGATITVLGAGSTSGSTDSSGNYSISSLNAGTYTVTLSVPSGYNSSTSSSVTTPLSDDTSVNFGISATVTPTPTPTGALTITNVSSTPTSSGAVITWTTNTSADSEVIYGATSLYGSNAVTDIDGTTSHSVSLTGLISCATYHYKVQSITGVGASLSGSDNTFTTLGCAGSASILSQSSALIPFSTGGFLANLDGNFHGLTLTVPTFYSAVSSVFQIHQLNPTSVYQSIPLPVPYRSIESYTYNAIALSSVSSLVSTFDQPITVTMYYGPSDINGIDQNTLSIMGYHGGSWSVLDSCSINTSVHKVICQTSTFSIFSLVTTQPVSSSSNSSSQNSSSNSSSNSPPGCSALPPVGIPSIFQIDASSTFVTLHIVPASVSTTSYTISYGPNRHDDTYAYIFQIKGSTGAIRIDVSALKRNTYYTFKIRANNNCAPGKWSDTFTIHTNLFQTKKTPYYRYQQKALIKQLQTKKWWQLWL